MKNSNQIKRISQYSALAGALMMQGFQGSAEIVYNDIDDLTVDDGYITIDLDENGIDDFVFEVDLSVFDVSMALGTGHRHGIGYTSNVFMGYQGTSFANQYFISALDPGAPISMNGSWLYAYPDIASYYYYPFLAFDWGVLGVQGAFVDAGEKIAGVKFRAGDGMHYGWIRLEVNLYPTQIVIYDYGYEADPETPLKAGQIDGCDVPVVIGTGMISATSARARWETVGSADYYQIQYHQLGVVSWTEKLVNAPRTFRNINGLLCDTEYEWKVRAVCADGTVTGFSPEQLFITNGCRSSAEMEPMDYSIYSDQYNLYINLGVEMPENCRLSIYSSTGQLVIEQPLYDVKTQLQPGLPSGIYIVVIKSERNSLTKKIVLE